MLVLLTPSHIIESALDIFSSEMLALLHRKNSFVAIIFSCIILIGNQSI